MKQGIMNKNVVHDGKSYPKGSKLSEEKHGDHFKVLAKAGHVDTGHEEKVADAPEVPPVEGEAEQEAVAEEKKHGRNRR